MFFKSLHECSVVSQLCAIPWTVACRAPLSMGLSWQPFPLPGDLPHPAMEPTSPAFTGRFFTTEPPGKPVNEHTSIYFLALAAERAKEQ